MLLSVLTILPNRFRKRFLMGIGGGLLLSMPHLFAVFRASSTNGPSWLVVPGGSFFQRYAGYLVHYAWWFALVIGLVLIWGIARGGLNKQVAQARWMLLDWVLLPVLLALGYSWLFTPVVHFGVLFFVVPFLTLLVFSFFGRLAVPDTVVMVLLLGSSAILSLIFERGFYDWHYGRGAEFMVRFFQEDHGGKKEGWMQVNQPFYLTYYEDQLGVEYRMNSYEIPDVDKMVAWADTTVAEQVAVGWLNRDLPLEVLPLLERYFPYAAPPQMWAISEYYELSRVPLDSAAAPPRVLLESDPGSWNAREVFVGTEQVIPYNYFTEYPEIISVECDVTIDTVAQALPQLVMSVEVNGEPRFWRSADLHLRPGTQCDYWADLAFRTRHLNVLRNPMAILKIYLWNPGQSAGRIQRLQLRRRPGNPALYAFVEDVY